MLVFMEGGKPENPEKNPQSREITNKKLNPHETLNTGIERRSERWEARAYPLRHLCSPLSYWIEFILEQTLKNTSFLIVSITIQGSEVMPFIFRFRLEAGVNVTCPAKIKRF